MDTKEFAELVEDILRDAEADEVVKIRTFADAGLMTRDAGLVVTTDDGSEFQITIVRSR